VSRSERYTSPAIALHWIVAALLIAQLGWGVWMQTIPKVPVGPRVDAFNLHKSLGMLILALMLVRLGWRMGHPAPAPLPAPRWQLFGARAVHALFYVALIAQPLIGFAGSAASGYPIRLFGFTIAPLVARNDALKEALSRAHLVVAIVIVTAVVLHVAAALWHALQVDGVMARMLPARLAGRPRDATSRP
jgi:cytochrome b561